MHRLSVAPASLVLALPLLLGGCGSGGQHSDARAHALTTPAPTRSSSAAPVGTGPLAGFALNLGYPKKNGDDGSRVTVRSKPATRAFGLCGRLAWAPQRAAKGVLGVTYRGEAEYIRGRTLAVDADVRAARVAVRRAASAVARCHDEPDGKKQATTHTLLHRTLGDQSVVWTDTFYNVYRGQKEHDTGLVVYELVRVGRAVLLAYQYDEGNGTPASRAQAIKESVRHERAVVERMRRLSPGGSRA